MQSIKVFVALFSGTTSWNLIIFGSKLGPGEVYRVSDFWCHRSPASYLTTLAYLTNCNIVKKFSLHFSLELQPGT